MKKTLLSVLILFSVKSFSQWNTNPAINTPVCSGQLNDQQDARIVTDSQGGAIITWLDFRNDPAQLLGDIFVQRLDKNGMAKWTTNGVALCNLATNQSEPSMVEDGNGGAIIAWNDWRNGNRDIYAQKIDSSGNVQWAASGLPVVVKANHQQDAKLISDGAGGAIIVWQDSLNGFYDIYAQRVNNSGIPTWSGGGVAICTATESQVNPKIETDAAGGAIIIWQDKRSAADYDIYAQRINSSGVVQWTANGVVLCSTAGTQSNPKIEPDGSGGALIGWQDKRNGLDYNIYAQRINSSGAVQWTANGIVVCSASNNQSAIDMTAEGISGAIISWKDQRIGNFDIYAQKIDLSGIVSWAANGITIATGVAPQYNPNIVGDGGGGAIIVWQDSTAGNWDVKSQRVDGNGTAQWTAGGVSVGTATDYQTSPKNVSDGMGGSIYAWQDKRNTLNFDIYAHRILSSGVSAGIEEPVVFVESKISPNPFSSFAVIEMNIQNINELRFSVANLLGEKIQIPFSVSENKINILRGDLTDGIYFYEIMVGNLVSKGKLIIIQ